MPTRRKVKVGGQAHFEKSIAPKAHQPLAGIAPSVVYGQIFVAATISPKEKNMRNNTSQGGTS